MADLHIDIRVHIEQPGPNPSWRYSVEIPIPPGYQEQDMEPFIRHELDRAVAALQEEEFGEARAARFVAAYELRMQVIRYLIRLAPRRREVLALASVIREIADLSNDELFERWEHLREHVED